MTRRLRVWLVLLAATTSVGCGSNPEPDSDDPRTDVDSRAPTREDERPATARLPAELPRETTGRPAGPGDWFVDVTEDVGIAFAYRDGNEAGFYQLLESVGGGGAAIDFDRDGSRDVFVNGGGRLEGPGPSALGLPAVLYRNDGRGRFEDVTAEAGAAGGGFYSHGCTVVDVDGDGFRDLVVAGFDGMQLLLNAGDGTFLDVTAEAGFDPGTWNVTAAGGDFDRDGLTDLYVLTYADWEPDASRECINDKGIRDICGPTLFAGIPDAIYRNRGDGTFENERDARGLVDGNRGLGVVTCDLDDDGVLDVAVFNDVQENQLYLNEGTRFREVGVLAGIAYSRTGDREGSMGVDVGDFDGDLLPDVWYTNYAQQDNSLMRRIDESGFLHVEEVTGMAGRSRPWVGFGTGFADLDADGWEDVFVLNGHVAYDRRDSPYFQPAQLFRNEDGKRFRDVSSEAAPYFDVPHSGRGGVVADFENDGGLDLLLVHQNDPVTLLRNRRPAEHWIAFDAVGTTSDRDAFGVRVVVSSGDRPRARWRRGGGGYLSSFDNRLWFALDTGEPVAAEVRWPSGRTERFTDLAPGRTHVLVEGRGHAD